LKANFQFIINIKNGANILKKVFHIILYAISFLVSVHCVLFLLLQNQQAQTLATKLVASFLSDELKAEITVGEVEIGFIGSFYLKKLRVVDMKGNPMVSIDKIDLAVKTINLTEKNITLKHLRMERVDFIIRKYAADEPGNFRYFINQFQSGVPDTLNPIDDFLPWNIFCDKLIIRNSHFAYTNPFRKTSSPSIDFNDTELFDMDFFASNFSLQGDTIALQISNLVFIEKSGFELKEFSGQFKFSPLAISADNLLLVTNNSQLDLDLEFAYENPGAFSDFISEVQFKSNFRPSSLDMSDIGYFAKTMFAMNNLIKFKGDISGTVDNISGKNIDLTYGNRTHFFGSVKMNGLPHFTETFIHADIDELISDASDAKSFNLPGETGSIKIPDLLTKMGEVTVQGKFTGFPNDFVSKASFQSRLGRLKTNLVLKTNPKDQSLAYKGDLVATKLDLGTLFSMKPQLGKTTFVMSVDGKGVDLSTLNISVNGLIRSLAFNGYDYRNISLDGTFNDMIFEGNTSIKDENLDFVFNGLVDFKDEMPRFDFHSVIHRANLKVLKLSSRDSTGIFSTNMKFDFFATSINDINGTIRFDSTKYIEGTQSYFLDSLLMESTQFADGKSGMSLRSDFADIEICGNYTISQLIPSIKKYIQNYSGNLANKISEANPSSKKQIIDINARLKNTIALTGLFIPNLKIAPNASLAGNIDLLKNNTTITAHADWLTLAQVKMNNCHFEHY